MKLHELETNRVYIGEDGVEYSHDGWHLSDIRGGVAVSCYATLTQSFTPKKVKRIVEEHGWLNKYPKEYSDCYHPTKEDADKNASANRIACVEMRGTYEVEVEL